MLTPLSLSHNKVQDPIPTQYTSAYKVCVRPQLEYCSTIWCPMVKLSNVELPDGVKHDYGQTSSVTEVMQSLHWRRLDQQRIDNKLSLMYKVTHTLITIPISDFLIPFVRPSRHYHPLSYRLRTNFHSFQELYFTSQAGPACKCCFN